MRKIRNYTGNEMSVFFRWKVTPSRETPPGVTMNIEMTAEADRTVITMITTAITLVAEAVEAAEAVENEAVENEAVEDEDEDPLDEDPREADINEMTTHATIMTNNQHGRSKETTGTTIRGTTTSGQGSTINAS